MQSAAELLPLTPSIEQLGRIIGNVAAPAFLLGAVASFISILFLQDKSRDRPIAVHSLDQG
jgi:hypothetical protein